MLLLTVRNIYDTGAALEVVTPLFILERFTLLWRVAGVAILFGAPKRGTGLIAIGIITIGAGALILSLTSRARFYPA